MIKLVPCWSEKKMTLVTQHILAEHPPHCSRWRGQAVSTTELWRVRSSGRRQTNRARVIAVKKTEGGSWCLGGSFLEWLEKASLLGEQTLERSKGSAHADTWGEEHSRQRNCKHQDPEMRVCLAWLRNGGRKTGGPSGRGEQSGVRNE